MGSVRALYYNKVARLPEKHLPGKVRQHLHSQPDKRMVNHSAGRFLVPVDVS